MKSIKAWAVLADDEFAELVYKTREKATAIVKDLNNYCWPDGVDVPHYSAKRITISWED